MIKVDRKLRGHSIARCVGIVVVVVVRTIVEVVGLLFGFPEAAAQHQMQRAEAFGDGREKAPVVRHNPFSRGGQRSRRVSAASVAQRQERFMQRARVPSAAAASTRHRRGAAEN